MSNENEEVYIVSNPRICGGKPVFKETRITLHLILTRYYKHGWSIDEICDQYPTLDKEIVKRVIEEYERNNGVVRVKFIVK